MKSKLITSFGLMFIFWLCLIINSNANVFSSNEQGIMPGQEFTIEIKSDISLGSYTIVVEDMGNFEFVTSSGQEGSGKNIITGSTINGTTELASFTFKVPNDEEKTMGEIKIKASGMETPNLETVEEQELIVKIGIKQDEQSNFVKEITLGENQQKAISFLLKDSEDYLTLKDLQLTYPGRKIEIDESDFYLKNGSTIKIDGQDYTIIIYGDINCDGSIGILDAVAVLNKVKAREELEECSVYAINKSSANDINILDAIKILNVVKGKLEYQNLY